jgi:hypothetical protein
MTIALWYWTSRVNLRLSALPERAEALEAGQDDEVGCYISTMTRDHDEPTEALLSRIVRRSYHAVFQALERLPFE